MILIYNNFNQNLFFVEVTMPPRIRKDFAEYLMPTIVSGVQSEMYTRDRRTDYGISVAHDIRATA